MLSVLVELRATTASLTLAEPFGIARGSRTTQTVVPGRARARGQSWGAERRRPCTTAASTVESATDFLDHSPLPRSSATIRSRSRSSRRGSRTLKARRPARPRSDAALHDWIGKRLGVPLWRLLGLSSEAPPTSYTIGIDSIDGTRDRVQRASEFRCAEDQGGRRRGFVCLEAVRDESEVPLRVDANEGWTLESARELMPELIRLGVEFVEQPFPAADLDSFLALRELHPRLPVVVDEGCQDLGDVGSGGRLCRRHQRKAREVRRRARGSADDSRRPRPGTASDARLHGRVRSSAWRPPPRIASLADWVDLDGHLLLADQPFTGLAPGRPRAARTEPGLGVGARMSERLVIFAEGLFAKHSGKTAHGVIRYGNRDVVAVIDSTCAGRTANEVEPFALTPHRSWRRSTRRSSTAPSAC